MLLHCRLLRRKSIVNQVTTKFRRYSGAPTTTKIKILNVAEKNNAAKSIAAVMSGGTAQMREGFSQNNKIYQFDYMLDGQQVTMNMTSVSGHLQRLGFAAKYSCAPQYLFDAPVDKYVPKRSQPIKQTLEREAEDAQMLIIWTDCDREGENIAFEIIDVVTKVTPNIQVRRAKFSEITDTSINRAIANLVPPDHLQNDAVDVRQEIDLRIGAAFTRFSTLRYSKAFPELADKLISYGSCQFPALGFVVERYKQIQEFESEPFWNLRTTLEEGGQKVDFSWKRMRLFDYERVKSFYNMCLEESTAAVTDVRKRNKSQLRPVALDTVEFEKIVSKKLKINAKKAMRIAEKLYISGYISYPRTETNQFPRNYNLRELVQNQTDNQNWGDFARRLLEEGITPRNGKKSNQAHPPMHPTKYASNLRGDDQKIYEFITRHFLACCSHDAEGFETIIEIDIASEKFSASGLVISDRNYLDVYPYDKWSDKEIPNFKKGDQYHHDVKVHSRETNSPELLTEADLITLMEDHGIGTAATHANHIEKIQKRGYARVQDYKFHPEKLGLGLVEAYDALGLEFSKPYLRAGLEADLKMICEGRKSNEDVLREQIATYRKKFEISLQKAPEFDEQMKKYLDTQMQRPEQMQQTDVLALMVGKCPSCGNDMTWRQWSSNAGEHQTQQTQAYYFIECTGYPVCRNAILLPRAMIDVSVLEGTFAKKAPEFDEQMKKYLDTQMQRPEQMQQTDVVFMNKYFCEQMWDSASNTPSLVDPPLAVAIPFPPAPPIPHLLLSLQEQSAGSQISDL